MKTEALGDDFFDYGLDELVNLPIHQPTLTETSAWLSPAALDLIDANDIWDNGGRRLNEVLEGLVPNLQVINHHFEAQHVGFRGIMGDRDDKYLLLVNGRVMNNRMLAGAFGERDQPLMGDLAQVEIVRGPASAIYGPGAITGVIHLVPYDGLSWQGEDVTLRFGGIEEFASIEFRKGMSLGRDHGLFLYYGLADYTGANERSAPYVFGDDFTTLEGHEVRIGEPIDFEVPKYRQTVEGDLFEKIHIAYNYQQFKAWARFTRGSEYMPQNRFFIDAENLASDASTRPGKAAGFGISNLQLTLAAELTQTIGSGWESSSHISWDVSDYVRRHGNLDQFYSETYSFSEQELFARQIFRGTLNENQQLAFGMEYSMERFGLEGIELPGIRNSAQQRPYEPWDTHSYSLLFESHTEWADQWDFFLSYRVDKHTYTDWLSSPRIALVYAPQESHVIKLIHSIANRRSVDDELRKEYLTSGMRGKEEKVTSTEVRWQSRIRSGFDVSASAYLNHNQIVAYALTDGAGRNNRIGSLDTWGVEFSSHFERNQWDVRISHGYTTLIDLQLKNPDSLQMISAYPYGYGKDLAGWSKHISKLAVTYEWLTKLRIGTTLVYYHGFPGDQDLADFNRNRDDRLSFIALSPQGYSEPYKGNLYWTVQATYEPNDRITAQLALHQLSQWFGTEVSKRNYLGNSSTYRSEPVSVSMRIRFHF